MIFTFLKYLQPTHYFSLQREQRGSVFPKVTELPPSILGQLKDDMAFSSPKAREYDLSWQALQKGYIGEAETYQSFEQLPLADEYRFIHKYFHPVWCVYVLLLRLASFRNPLQEFSDYRKGRRAKRSNYLQNPIYYSDYSSFQSSLLERKPLVSVIIPTLNRYEYLKDVLNDLEQQDYKNFEVLVIDQSAPFQKEFYESFNLKLRVVPQKERALWLARNNGVRQSKGEIIMLSEDDVRVRSNWINEHLKCLDFFDADISAGIFYPEGGVIPDSQNFFHIASQFATGNAALYKTIFKKVGLFDRQFEKQRMGDGEFGLRCYLNGFRSIANPVASCVDVKAAEGGLREMGSWDAFRTKKWFAPRPIPSVLYLFRKYYGNHQASLALLKTVPPSIMPYKFKKNKPMLLLGAILSVFLLPVIFIQVYKSWKLSSKKLKEGDRIGEF